jgi:hypothetical protein
MPGRARAAHTLVLASAAAVLAAAVPAAAQTGVELRGSTARYRFADLNHTFPSGIMADALYLGIPGQNELYLGLGYTLKPARWLTVVPLAYGVAGREEDERGIALCASVSVEAGAWKAIAFAGRFVRASGGVATYDFVDSVDVTRKVRGRWDAGVSSTVYRLDTGWTHQTGPMVRRNDARGSWALSARAGDGHELRLVRVLTFGAP